MEKFWPGPLTIVGKQQPSLQWDLGDTRGTVAIRMPDHPLALELLERTGPLAVIVGQPDRAAGRHRRRAGRGDARGPRERDHRRRVPRRGPRPPRSSTSPACRAGCCAVGALGIERAQRGARAPRHHPDRRGLRDSPVREYVLVFLVAAVVTYLLTVRRARVRAADPRGGGRSATATCTTSRSPTSAGWRCSGGLVAAYLVATRAAVPRARRPLRLRPGARRADRRRRHLRRGRARRHLRPRRADEVRRAVPGRRDPGLPGRAVHVRPPARAGRCSPSTSPRARC